MNIENINAIISAVQNLKNENINIQLDPEKIISDFESIQERNLEGGYTLSTEYRMIKNIQSSMFQSLSMVADTDVDKFVPLSIAVEHIKSKLSHEYETNL